MSYDGSRRGREARQDRHALEFSNGLIGPATSIVHAVTEAERAKGPKAQPDDVTLDLTVTGAGLRPILERLSGGGGYANSASQQQLDTAVAELVDGERYRVWARVLTGTGCHDPKPRYLAPGLRLGLLSPSAPA